MAMQSVRSYKLITVRMLNCVKPAGNGWTVDSVLTLADLTLTDLEVMRWFNMRVWGYPGPAPDHAYLPLVSRSNSILYRKKQISFFMPNRMQPWDHIVGNTGNPTRCNVMAS
jgi:hypothetical protein